MAAYLFPHFTSAENGDREQIWFSVSKDGLNWIDLGGEEPFIEATSGTTGIRDPFIVYDKKIKKYFIIGTDLCTTKGGNWHDYSHKGSRSLFVWESENLIDWSKEKLIEVGIPEAGNVWAPEAVYCEEKESWFVFFASNVREKRELTRKQRIYGAYTKDFETFSPTFKFMEAKTSLIDTNIVRDGGYYYRFTKDETHKKIIIERSKVLVPEKGEEYEKIHSDYLADYFGLEGPECYKLPDGRWCLIVDRYHEGKGYFPLICDDLSSGVFYELSENEYDIGPRKKRHGSVIEISDEEAEGLMKHFGCAE